MTSPQDTPDLDRRLGTLTEERTQTSFGDGDHERFAHYVQKDKIVESAVTGTPVIALCGKVWVPNRDPQRFPVCPECKEIYDSIPAGGGDAGG
jgi:Protein of unknown function (DUF3039)